MKKTILILCLFFMANSVSAQPFVGVSGSVGMPIAGRGEPVGFQGISNLFGLNVYGGYAVKDRLFSGVSLDIMWDLFDQIDNKKTSEFSIFSYYIITHNFPVSPYLGFWAGHSSFWHGSNNSLFITPTIGFETGARKKGLALDVNVGYKMYKELFYHEQNLSMVFVRVGAKYKF
jgi:hypothetical protein